MVGAPEARCANGRLGNGPVQLLSHDALGPMCTEDHGIRLAVVIAERLDRPPATLEDRSRCVALQSVDTMTEPP